MTALSSLSLPLGLGTSRLRSVGGGLSRRSALRLLNAAFELGIRLIDTAPSYGQGAAEQAIGRLPTLTRHDLVISTKVGYENERQASLVNIVKPIVAPMARMSPNLGRLVQGARQELGSRAPQNDISSTLITESLQRSLSRLRRDQIDLLFLHDPTETSLNDDILQALDKYVKGGDVSSWGVSTGDPAVARRALDLEGMSILQLPINPQWVERGGLTALDVAAARGMPVVANRVLVPFHDTSNRPSDGVISAPSVSTAFAFALNQPAVSAVICGTTRLNHLTENVHAFESVVGN